MNSILSQAICSLFTHQIHKKSGKASLSQFSIWAKAENSKSTLLMPKK